MKLSLIVIAVLSAAVAGVVGGPSPSAPYDLKLVDIDGKETTLGQYRGKVLLIVNVASKCGFTPQYAGLEQLYRKYRDRGLVVLGFPCNQFGNQEPGTPQEIKEFCTTRYQVSFPLFSKIEVNGPGRHPLYQWLAGPDSPYPGDIRWNFTKFLVSRDGRILKRFDSRVAPESEELVQAIEAALKEK
ncbi:glutathione peroxidase [Limisphaera sp. VF-2]|jgi:glutathione peroxidase|uniref:glutathione peroxidase n=1 Tax=Limisphaera sp. VF-2 TaxID=3400418 RepID=UPI0017608E8A